ncbi:hypothetical protein [Pedobacter frigoris]|uniref:Iron complex transport system substrate-binding protein n=1 Tax=Pedobacter frigoris TaxID=2571272 RepID=A0A4U1CCB7_9SPHI|nr:hypothetical protein [Pedobacter frigoris]TKC03736.1 hypothetical protein FA047_19440 [Pedobacter frigoris]
MTFFDAVISRVEDLLVREELQERVDIIQHKIKFMDKVPVVCLSANNAYQNELEDIITAAGGVLEKDVMLARVLIYHERDTNMLQLMGSVPSLLQNEWPSVAYNRVYLYDDRPVIVDAVTAVDALEDVAEMLYPGFFVFGNEGKTWMSFKTQ